MMNNFRQWADMEGFSSKPPPQEVKRKLRGTMGLVNLMGDMVVLFIPKVFDVFTDLMGGRGPNKKEMSNKGDFKDERLPKYPNTKE